MSKQKTISKQLAEAQVIFNKYIRLRDSLSTTELPDMCRCISCGSITPKEKLNAGHFRTTGSSSVLRFNEKNVNGQCIRCNKYLHGNLGAYAIELDKKYGSGTAESLQYNHEIKMWKSWEIDEIKEEYKRKYKELKDNNLRF